MLSSNLQFNYQVPYRIALGPVVYHNTDENIKTKIQAALSKKCGVDLSKAESFRARLRGPVSKS